MYGFPTIGNLMPGLTIDDTRKVVITISELIKKRKEDMEFKGNIRQKFNRIESKNTLLEQENDKLKEK